MAWPWAQPSPAPRSLRPPQGRHLRRPIRRFGGAEFGGNARFDEAKFGGSAVFGVAAFGGSVEFKEARFGVDAEFEGTVHRGRVFDPAEHGVSRRAGGWFR